MNDTPEDIVRALQASDPIVLDTPADEFTCALCNEGFPHTPNCPWERANYWVLDHPQ